MKVTMKLKSERIRLLPGESFRLLQWQNNIHDVEIVAADGTRRPFSGSGHEWHHHSQMELALIAKGAGTLFIGDSITPFTAPDLVLIGSNLPHYWHMPHPSFGYAIQFDFEPEHPFWQFPETGELRALWIKAQRGLRLSGPTASDIAGLIRTSLSCGGMGRLSRFMRILEALAKADSLNCTTVSSTTFVPPARQATYQSLQKAIYLAFHRFHEQISFSEVLRETRMSKATFERHFKRHTGKTFTQFLSEIRLNHASRQLLETELSISEIALASGYNNISHFNHQFLALYRRSPREFRRSLRPAKG